MGKIVVPGEAVSDKPNRMSYCYIENEKTYATVPSMMSDEGKLVPLRGPYEPLEEDFVVGVVVEVRFAGYNVDIKSPYIGFISSRDTHDKFQLGDVVYAKIREVTEVKDITLTDAMALKGGRIISVSPVKVPRLIGKKNSMVNMIKEATGCDIFIGRNGYVWLGKGNTELAIKAARKVEAEAHIPGLTDRVAAFLKENINRG